MEREEEETMEGDNLVLVLLDTEMSKQSEPLAVKGDGMKKALWQTNLNQEDENLFELSDDDDVLIIDESSELINPSNSYKASASISHETTAADRITETMSTIQMSKKTTVETMSRDKMAKPTDRSPHTSHQEEDITTIADPQSPKKRVGEMTVTDKMVSKEIGKNVTSGGREQLNKIRSSSSNAKAEIERGRGEMPPPSVPPLTKEESIKKVLGWYRDYSQQKMSIEGVIPYRTLHEAAVNQTYERVSASDSQINVKYWNEMRMHLLAERQRFEKSNVATLKSMTTSLELFKDGYLEGMSEALVKYFTADPPSGVITFESVTAAVHEKYIHCYAQQQILSEAHAILLPLMGLTVENEYKNLISTKQVITQYQELMKDAILTNSGCSDSLFDNLHQNCVQKTLAAGKSSRKHLVALDNQLMVLIKDLYIDEIKEIRKLETEISWQTLENYYWAEMTKNCQQFYYKSSDIKVLHEHFVELCETVIQNCFYAGINVDSIKNRLLELLQHFVKANDRKIENAAKTVGSITSKAEIRFNEMAAGQLCGKAMNDAYFVATALKMKTEVLQDMRTELGNVLPVEGDRHFLYLQRLLDFTCGRLRQENGNKLIAEELKGCAAPVMIIQFGAKAFCVACVSHDGKLIVAKCNTGEEKIQNSLCFLKSGEYIFGITQAEKVLEIAMEDLMDLPEKPDHSNVQVNVHGELLQIPLDFQFACTLMLNKLLEVTKGKYGTVRSALITVPLWLRSLQRQQLKDAALTVGFEQVFLVNETSAAMLAQVGRHSSTDGACATDTRKGEETLVLSCDGHNFTAAVYKHNSEQVFGGKLTMTFSTGLCHQVLGWKSHLFSRLSQIGPDTVINNVFEHSKNIRRVLVLCDDANLREEYSALANAKIKGAGPPQPFPVPMQKCVMQGAREYALRLLQKISTATQLINDLTFYDLEINDPTLSNKCIMNRQTPLGQHRVSSHTVPINGLTISEIAVGKSKVCYPLDMWTVQEGQIENNATLTCFANKEGIFELYFTEGALVMAAQRQRTIYERSQFLQKHFKQDEQLEAAKRELTAIANYILENKGSLKGFWNQQIPLEANQALKLLQKPKAKKRDILNSLKMLKGLKIQQFGTDK